MQQTNSHHSPALAAALAARDADDDANDLNIVSIWLRTDPVRWAAGAAAGILAGVVAMVAAGLISKVAGMEFLFPVKLMGTVLLGAPATAIGPHMGAILTGFVTFEVLAAFLGVAYAHFTGTNYLPALLGIGFVWGTFSWIFIWNLFMMSIWPIRYSGITNAPVFPVCLVFGIALTSVAFFDRAFRGKAL